jgi:hypothetical protein
VNLCNYCWGGPELGWSPPAVLARARGCVLIPQASINPSQPKCPECGGPLYIPATQRDTRIASQALKDYDEREFMATTAYVALRDSEVREEPCVPPSSHPSNTGSVERPTQAGSSCSSAPRETPVSRAVARNLLFFGVGVLVMTWLIFG